MIHADVLGERARLSPERVALVDVPTGDRWTYAALDRRAARLANVWEHRLGLVPGDRLGLLAHNCVDYVAAVFAAAKSGIILVPLSTRVTAHELGAVVRDCGMRGLLHGGAFNATVDALRATAALEFTVALDAQPELRGDQLTLERLIEGVTAERPEARPMPEAPLLLLYTSGTTGAPKGVITPHRMVAWNAYNTAICWQLREDDISPVFTPLYHAGGLGAFLVPLLAVGGTVVLLRGFDPAEVWRTIERERCTVVLGVPTIWKLLADAPEFASVDLSHVRWFISGGAPLPRAIMEPYLARGLVFKQGYGLTEVGVNCFAMSAEESVRKAGTIGRPLMFTRAKLVAEDGTEVPVGEVGELCLAGPHVCSGYWNNPEATAAAIDPEGWFHTGDLATRDEEGFFTIVGRRKDMFISGGVNVYPAEIEAVLLGHPDVADAAVIGVPHEIWGEVGVAFIVAAPGRAPTADSLRQHLLGTLARFKVPHEFLFVDHLPRTPYGKVVKAELREQYAAGRTARGAAHGDDRS